jgi:hypothetical protein
MDFNRFGWFVLETLHKTFGMSFVIEDGKIRKVIYHE